jgi:hypothetical protein
MQHIHKAEYYSFTERTERLICVKTWISLKKLCKVKEADTKVHILFDSMSIKYPNR